ncbi:cation diffusion facilitator family transporter [Treponema sp.]|uniref:cation diffusion facilitator family transporter n=1 Tax=Treponema sp. TaxID=166 RepID=UPI003F123F2A
MKHSDLRAHYIKTAGIVALSGNVVLAAVKFLFAYLSGSLAVAGDAIDSSTDVLIAFVTLFVSRIIQQPGDKEHPWGHARAETTATMALAFIIFFAGGQLVLSAVKKLICGDFQNEISLAAVYAAVVSMAGKTLLAVVQFHYGKIAESEIVKANAQNMKNDIALSGAVLAGLLLSEIFKMPVLDPVVALLVGAWVIKNAALLFARMNMELMDGNADSSLYRKLFDAVATVPNVKNPHKARIRRMASSFDVDLDIEVDPMLSVYEAHELSEQVESAIRKEIPEIYDIVIHIEPNGSDGHQPKEEFGLTPGSL